MTLRYSNISCGVMQLSDLASDYVAQIKEMLDSAHAQEYYYRGRLRFSQVIFSDNLDYGHSAAGTRRYSPGVGFAKYITDNALGTITESPPIVNRNTNNTIKTWIWNIDDYKKVIKHVGWKVPKHRKSDDSDY